MINKIIEVANRKTEILSEQPPPYCSCGEQWFSAFDKLYLATYGKCVSCTTNDYELTKNSENIFAIL